MSEPNGPSQRLDFTQEVLDISWKNFEQIFPWFDRYDPFLVDGTSSEVRIFYVSEKASDSGCDTFIDCRLHFNSSQMWIGAIQVAACHRRQGLGGQLVRAAEATASALGIREVRILPLPSSTEFWSNLDFVPVPRAARVLSKTLISVYRTQCWPNRLKQIVPIAEWLNPPPQSRSKKMSPEIHGSADPQEASW